MLFQPGAGAVNHHCFIQVTDSNQPRAQQNLSGFCEEGSGGVSWEWFFDPDPTEVIFTSDHLARGSRRQCFRKKRHSCFWIRPFSPLIGIKMPLPLPKKTGFSRVPACDRQGKQAGARVRGMREMRRDPGIKPGPVPGIFLGARFGRARLYAQNASSGFALRTYRAPSSHRFPNPGLSIGEMRSETSAIVSAARHF
jgi:hypothetical protein